MIGNGHASLLHVRVCINHVKTWAWFEFLILPWLATVHIWFSVRAICQKAFLNDWSTHSFRFFVASWRASVSCSFPISIYLLLSLSDCFLEGNRESCSDVLIESQTFDRHCTPGSWYMVFTSTPALLPGPDWDPAHTQPLLRWQSCFYFYFFPCFPSSSCSEFSLVS